jgi:hypothetical protein
MKKDDNIIGKDIYGNTVKGIITNIMPTFGIAQVRTGEDRLDVTSCEIRDIKESN